MKWIITISAILLFALAGCGKDKQSTNELITVDVIKNYPEKELTLQDFMDVEYIPLETNDEFVTQGKVMAIGAEVILITNWANDGNLFVFDRKTGKALKKINRKGQGGEEYIGITEIVLDEANKEIFVIAYTGSKISVYDLDGNFKRSFKAAGTESHVNTFNYDRENLISYVPDNSLENPSNAIPPYYLIFSKQDGSITRKISIPFDEVKSPVARDGENWENWAAPVPTAMYQIVPDHTNWVLMETSSDTIYHYLPDANTTIPLIVRTPSIHSMDPPEVFLIPTVFTDRYYFMSLLKAEFNFETGRGFPISGLMYDRLENSLFIPKIYNGDYTSKREVDMTSRPLDPEFVIGQSLQAHELAEAKALLGEDPSTEINAVRERAYGSEYFNAHKNEVAYPNDKGSFYNDNPFEGGDENVMEAILKERLREFFFEGKRWYDLRRFGNQYVLKYTTAQESRLLWPINEDALTNNPALKQTPGY